MNKNEACYMENPNLPLHYFFTMFKFQAAFFGNQGRSPSLAGCYSTEPSDPYLSPAECWEQGWDLRTVGHLAVNFDENRQLGTLSWPSSVRSKFSGFRSL